MGSCLSQVDRNSDRINRQLEEGSEGLKKECNILLLGSGESGKSTIIKQMRIIHQEGFSNQELAEFRPVIYRNVIDSVQQVTVYMKMIGLEYVEYSNRALADKVLEFRIDTTPDGQPYFPTEIAEAISQMWKDPIIPKIMQDGLINFYLMDSAVYFFSEALRIGSPGYLPNETDVLRARQKSVGIVEMRFTMGQLSICMFDVGGQRSERKNWIHCFKKVTSIIFCTALSEYDQVLLEEKSQNRMKESLVLFESLINSRWLLGTSIILFLNKIDVFENKLPKVPLERYFSQYAGGPDVNKAVNFILQMFMLKNRARLRVYPHLTQATDTTNIRLVFAAAKETISQNALKDSEIL